MRELQEINQYLGWYSLTEAEPCIMSLNVPTLDMFSLPLVPKWQTDEDLFLEYCCFPKAERVS